MWEVAVALKTLVKRWDEPKLRAIANAVRDAGLGGPGQSARGNIPAIVQLLHPMLFDSRPAVAINHNRTNAVLGLPRPPRRRAPKPAPATNGPKRPISQNRRKFKKQSNRPEGPTRTVSFVPSVDPAAPSENCEKVNDKPARGLP
jgi:hypothetical protein